MLGDGKQIAPTPMNDRKLIKIQHFAHVPRETAQDLALYVGELSKWQQRINLISDDTLDAIWQRHIADSLQLIEYLDLGHSPLIDVGAGAGFPGLPLCIATRRPTILVERDARKAAFLRAVVQIVRCPASIAHTDAARFRHHGPKIIVSRAVAAVGAFLDLVETLVTPETYILLLKGKRAQDELTAASKHWTMRAETHPSRTSPDGVILRLSDIQRRHDAPDRLHL
ncbi:MAG: 16S rRNA (guanine(527)-N(7))-methyltransferase RsmG [Alphaproteobacteria bacterium]|nr:16S rRNA (guanine(527)-N(7))-methyltransferase RsmG [Alphaproteobacteria bacterium]